VFFAAPPRHPNVDEISGRICLDLLKLPPDGAWRPNVSLQSLLTSIRVLLGAPNLDDPMRPDLIAEWLRSDPIQPNSEEDASPQPKRPRMASLSLSARNRSIE